MAEIASAFVTIAPSARGFGSKLNSQVGGEVDKAGKASGKRFGLAMKGGALAALGGAVIAGAFLKDAVGAAGDLEQSVGAIDTVFGKSAKHMHIWSKQAAQSVGLTKNEYNELGTLIGSQLKNGGTAMDELAPKANDLIVAGADLSSMFGGSTKEAVEALSSALKGERDPIERYGVSLNQAKIDAEAAALGFTKVDGALTDQAKQAATLSLITKQTADAQGNFAKESGTLAGQQQRLTAEFGNMKTSLGTALLPAITTVVTGLNNLGQTFKKEGLSGVATQIGQKITEALPVIRERLLAWGTAFVEWITPIIPPLLAKFVGLLARLGQFFYGTALPAIIAALVQWGKAFVEWIGPQISPMIARLGELASRLFSWLIDVGLPRLLSNLKRWGEALVKWIKPMIPPVIAEIAKLLGRLVTWLVGTGLPKLLGALLKLGVALVKWIGPQVPKVIADMAGLMGKLAGWVVNTGLPLLGEKMLQLGNKAFDKLKSASQSGTTNVIDFMKGIPGRLVTALGDLGSLFYNKGVELIAGFARGITAKMSDAIDAVQSGLSRIKGLLPGSPIKWGPLKNWNNGGAGKRLMDLVSLGITKATPKTVKAAKSAFEKISDSLTSQRDKIRSTLDGLKSDFASLSDSVSSAFTGDLFGVAATEAVAATGDTAAIAGRTVGQNFIDNLMGKKAELTGLLASFNILKGWGIDPAFLSQLFASGNGALITELAGMDQAGAVGAANLFADVQSLGGELGNAVASNDPVAKAIEDNGKELREVNRQLSFLADDIGKQLNGAAAQAQRDKKNRGKK